MSHASSTCMENSSPLDDHHQPHFVESIGYSSSHYVSIASGVRVSVWGEEIGPHVGVLVVELHGEMMMSECDDDDDDDDCDDYDDDDELVKLFIHCY